MKKPWFLIVVGLALVGLGSTGLALFHFEVRRQQEESRATADAQAREMDEQRAHVEELKRQLDDERSMALEARLKLLNEGKRRDEEAARYKREIEALAAKVRKQSAGEAGQESTSPARIAGNERREAQASVDPLRSRNLQKKNLRGDRRPDSMERPHSREYLTLRVDLDPVRSPELRVAHVHVGDKVRIRVKRPERGRGRIYAGLSPLGFLAEASPRGPVPMWVGPPSPVIFPVADNDRFDILSPAGLDPVLGSTFSSREGAILTVTLGPLSREALGYRGRPMRGGVYEVEVTIETNNRWDIPPRSLL